MFSKEESKKLRQDFWIAFGKSFPRKWILYDTKIKGLTFRFTFDLKKAIISMDVEHTDLETRIALWNKLVSLKSLLIEDYWPKANFEDSYALENGKEISRIFLQKEGVSIHNKNSWQETMEFLNKHMKQLEAFFLEYRDIIDS